MVLLSSHFISQFVLSGLYYSFVCLQLCSSAQFWLCIWLPDGGKSQFYWLVSLFLYLKFISNYKSIIGVYLIALGSTFTLDDLVDFPAGFWVGLLFLQLTSYFVFFISFYDPGPHGNFRYSQNMLPEVTETDFRKGSQVILQSSLLIFFNLRSFWWRSLFWL